MVYAQVRSIVVSLGVADALVAPESVLDQDLGLDSTEIVELRALLKKTFPGFALPERWYRGKTVSDLCQLVESHQSHAVS
jgi:acyl carrier protein